MSDHLKKEFLRMKEELNESLGVSRLHRALRMSEVHAAVVLQSPYLCNLLCQAKGAIPVSHLKNHAHLCFTVGGCDG